MYPITILAAEKTRALLAGTGALAHELEQLMSNAKVLLPVITAEQVVLSSASPDVGDKDMQLTYPRVCLYSTGLKNTQAEKFRSVSGSLSVVADIWASANLATDSDLWIHYYVSAVTAV